VRLGHVLKTPAGIAAVVGVVAGVGLFLTLFMSWGENVCVREPCPYATGWQTLRVLDIPIAVLAVAGAVVAILSLLGWTARAGLLLAGMGGVAAVLILLAPLVERQDTPLFEFGRGAGWWLGLLAALVVLVCGVTIWAMSSGALERGEE
jgi:hypothetical protein